MYVCALIVISLVQTCRKDGTVQVWGAEDAALISSFSLETEVLLAQ